MSEWVRPSAHPPPNLGMASIPGPGATTRLGISARDTPPAGITHGILFGDSSMTGCGAVIFSLA